MWSRPVVSGSRRRVWERSALRAASHSAIVNKAVTSPGERDASSAVRTALAACDGDVVAVSKSSPPPPRFENTHSQSARTAFRGKRATASTTSFAALSTASASFDEDRRCSLCSKFCGNRMCRDGSRVGHDLSLSVSNLSSNSETKRSRAASRNAEIASLTRLIR